MRYEKDAEETQNNFLKDAKVMRKIEKDAKIMQKIDKDAKMLNNF
jgi:hypothetical protein